MHDLRTTVILEFPSHVGHLHRQLTSFWTAGLALEHLVGEKHCLFFTGDKVASDLAVRITVLSWMWFH